MVIINFEVAFARDFKIKQAVTRKQIEHVIEERQPGADLRLSCAVKVEDDTHVCLFCLSVDFRGARLILYLCFHNHPLCKPNQPVCSHSPAACRRTVRKAYGLPSTNPLSFLRLSLRKEINDPVPERLSLSALC